VRVDDSLAAFIEAGLPTHLATSNARLVPNAARVTATRAEADREHLVVYVPEVAAAPLLDDLRDTGQAAVCIARPSDHHSCQVKGVFVDARPCREDERAFVMDQWARSLESMAVVGVPPAGAVHYATWPAVAIRLRVTACFDQTPGPGAGARLT
jgi:hypothetical protein